MLQMDENPTSNPNGECSVVKRNLHQAHLKGVGLTQYQEIITLANLTTLNYL